MIDLTLEAARTVVDTALREARNRNLKPLAVVVYDARGALKAALDASTADGVTSPQSQPDLLVPTPVANAMYDSIYGVIQGQLTPEAALELVQKALDTNRG